MPLSIANHADKHLGSVEFISSAGPLLKHGLNLFSALQSPIGENVPGPQETSTCDRKMNAAPENSMCNRLRKEVTAESRSLTWGLQCSTIPSSESE